MSINIDQVLCSRARWRLSFLAPFWALQVAILLCLMGVFAYRLVDTFEYYDEGKKNGQAPLVEVVWEATNVGFSTISLVLTIIEISRLATDILTPFLMLCTHIIKLVLSLAILGLDVTVYLQRTDRHYSIVALALDCGLLAAAISTFVYSVKTYRRLLKYENYVVSNGPNHDLEFGTKVSRFGGKHTSVNTAYISTTVPEAGNLKGEIDSALDAEFGWADDSKPRGVVVGAGVVPRSSKIESQVDLPRTASWVTERGNTVGTPTSLSDPGTEGGDNRPEHTRHSSIPTVIVSGHDDDAGDDDTQALLHGGSRST
ncbi:hypothetical protein QBC37DRAFT_200207 [Rhypophila decipiens]|uniref:Uncharacterized protein n=1 Tax=Rhypophila decipiens TaxID=261697 RepID=A0AAN7BCM2_9PEZI|nr:hypothetical protein QBC37DRAFT_200207 [Rhypophila decipiens]